MHTRFDALRIQHKYPSKIKRKHVHRLPGNRTYLEWRGLEVRLVGMVYRIRFLAECFRCLLQTILDQKLLNHWKQSGGGNDSGHASATENRRRRKGEKRSFVSCVLPGKATSWNSGWVAWCSAGAESTAGQSFWPLQELRGIWRLLELPVQPRWYHTLCTLIGLQSNRAFPA